MLVSQQLSLRSAPTGEIFDARTRRLSGQQGPHQQYAMMFLFNAIVIGVGIAHCKFISHFAHVQETVALFLVGVVYSLIQRGLQVEDDIGIVGDSYKMWMNIDPHLLLWTLLPALLTGDAMTIDTFVAKRVAKQCVYLAGPGVLLQSMIVASVISWALEWPFLLGLVLGSILCATDPVAVVALLKELGCSPVLTMQIQGESLLNDGTAIVLFTIAYRMLSGEEFDMSDIIMFLITVAGMAWALGMAIGLLFYAWISAADNKLEHGAAVIQITLTLACGYWSFIIAEGVFHISGVLACVGSALTLAHFMWPHVVCPTSMKHFWHMLEWLGNTIIFFLAGALVGNSMVNAKLMDFFHVLGIYLLLLVCRGTLFFVSRPLLQRLNDDREDVTLTDVAVMTWGGLRGAVGLALAIQVFNERAVDELGVPQVTEEQARQVLFFVGGVAFLTTVVNATTCPALVRCLGLTAPSVAKIQLIALIHKSLERYCESAGNLPAGVASSLHKVLAQIEHHIDASKTAAQKIPTGETPQSGPVLPSADAWQQPAAASRLSGAPPPPGDTASASHHRLTESSSMGLAFTKQLSATIHSYVNNAVSSISATESHTRKQDDFLKDFFSVRRFFQKVEKLDLRLCGLDVESKYSIVQMINEAASREDLLIGILSQSPKTHNSDDIGSDQHLLDDNMSKLFSTVFLSLVKSSYMRQMETRVLAPGSDESSVLLHSCQIGLSYPRARLFDFVYIFEYVMSSNNSEVRPEERVLAEDVFAVQAEADAPSLTHLAEQASVRAQFRRSTASCDVTPPQSTSGLSLESNLHLPQKQISTAMSTGSCDVTPPQKDALARSMGSYSPMFDSTASLPSVASSGSNTQATSGRNRAFTGSLKLRHDETTPLVAMINSINAHQLRHDRTAELADATNGAQKSMARAMQQQIADWTESTAFSLIMASAILFSGLYIGIEELLRTGDDHRAVWLTVEIAFTVLFFFEFVCKLIALGLRYFLIFSNVFDFALVVTGVIGCVLELAASSGTTTGGEARLIRMSRVFKVARFLRLFRIFELSSVLLAKLGSHELNTEAGEDFKRFKTLTAYIKAHLHAQRDLIQLLCPAFNSINAVRLDPANAQSLAQSLPTQALKKDVGPIMPAEMASCLIESQVAIYVATTQLAHTLSRVNKETLMQVNAVMESKDYTEQMESIVLDAEAKGVISGREAQAITHPLHKHISHCQHIIAKTLQGFDFEGELNEELFGGQMSRESLAGDMVEYLLHDVAEDNTGVDSANEWNTLADIMERDGSVEDSTSVVKASNDRDHLDNLVVEKLTFPSSLHDSTEVTGSIKHKADEFSGSFKQKNSSVLCFNSTSNGEQSIKCAHGRHTARSDATSIMTEVLSVVSD